MVIRMDTYSVQRIKAGTEVMESSLETEAGTWRGQTESLQVATQAIKEPAGSCWIPAAETQDCLAKGQNTEEEA